MYLIKVFEWHKFLINSILDSYLKLNTYLGKNIFIKKITI